MTKEIEYLTTLANFFKKINTKIKLLSLIKKAKQEYDKYDYESSLESLKDAYEVNPENPVVLRGLGCLKQFNKEYEEALIYYKKALEFSDAKEIEYTLIGMVYYIEGKLDEAVENFNLAIDENDNYTEAYEGRNQAMLENHLKILDLQESLKKYF